MRFEHGGPVFTEKVGESVSGISLGLEKGEAFPTLGDSRRVRVLGVRDLPG